MKKKILAPFVSLALLFFIFSGFSIAMAQTAIQGNGGNATQFGNGGNAQVGSTAGTASGTASGSSTTGTVDSTGCNSSQALCNPIPSVTTVGGFVQILLSIILTIGIPIVAFFIIYSGFLFVMARGKPEDLETAKRAFGYTVIGAALLLGAWVFAQAISATVNALK